MASGRLNVETCQPSVQIDLPVFPQWDLPKGEVGAVIYVLSGINKGGLRFYGPKDGVNQWN